MVKKMILKRKSVFVTLLCSIFFITSPFYGVAANNYFIDAYALESDVLDGMTDVISNENFSLGLVHYVGGIGPNNYTFIQNAIENASNGDTIFVYDGVYYETVEIEKEIFLIGESKDNTIIDGEENNPTVTIAADSVFLSSFKIQNGKYYGVYIDNSHGSFVNNSIIKNNQNAGIYGACAINCTFSNNVITENTNGLFLDYNSRDCILYDNVIKNQSLRGVYFKNSYTNTIKGCNINDNEIGIALHYCYNISVVNNLITNHTDHGIKLKSSSENSIKNNTFNKNYEGIRIEQLSNDNIIKNNDIYTNNLLMPMAIDDCITTEVDSTVEINVTRNDYDQDGSVNSSSLSIITDPSYGSILNISAGKIRYQPNTGYNGSDFFTYSIKDNDNLNSNIAKVTINMIGTDLGEEIKYEQVIFNRSLPIYNEWQMAQTLRMQAETITKISLFLKKVGSPQSPLHIQVRKDTVDGELTFADSLNPNEVSTVYDWIVCDDEDFSVEPGSTYFLKLSTSSGNIYNNYEWGYSTSDTFNMGRAMGSFDDGDSWESMNTSDFCFKIFGKKGISPVAANDSYKIGVNTELKVTNPNILSNDYDYDQGPITMSALLENNVTHGQLDLNANGSFEYMPNPGYVGYDSFSYKTTDGEYNSSTAHVQIQVLDSLSFGVVIPESISSSTNNNIYHNNFYSQTYNHIVYDYYTNFWDNRSTNSFGGNYWSFYNEPGEGAKDINEDGINDDPYNIMSGSNDDGYPLLKPWKNFLPAADFSWHPVGPETSLKIQYTDESVDSGYGSIINWSWTFGDGSTSFEQHPIHQYQNIGVYNVSLRIIDDDDNQDLFFSEVTVSANPPTANFTWSPLVPYTQDIVNFTDLSVDDGNVVSWIWDFGDGINSNQQNPQHYYVDDGLYTVTLTVGDDDGAIDVISKTITILNMPPNAINDTISINENELTWISPLSNDYDVDGVLDISSFNIMVYPVNGTVLEINSSTSEILYSPNTNYSGTDLIEYQIYDDDGDFDTAIIFIQINDTNIHPVAEDDNYSTFEDTSLIVTEPGVLENDFDPDESPSAIVAELVVSPTFGTITLNQNGSFYYMPETNYYGGDTFTYTAFDGENYSNNATVTITINGINDAPVAVNDSYLTYEDMIFKNYSLSVLDNDFDVDNSSMDLSAQLVQDTTNGNITLHNNGSMIYTPNTNFYGSDSFTYRVYDGLTYSNNATVLLEVQNINDPPVAYNDSYVVNEDNSLIVDPPGVLINDTDIDSTELSAIKISDTDHGELFFYTDGGFEYIPDDNFYGFDSFTYQAFDGLNVSNTAQVTIQVSDVNEPPISYNDSYILDEDTLLSVSEVDGVIQNDYDPDSGPNQLSAVLENSTVYGLLDLNDTGSFTYLPNENFTGLDTFQYVVFDGLDYSSPSTVHLTVLNINDPPSAVDNLYSMNEDTSLSVSAPGVLGNDYDAESNISELSAILVDTVTNGTLIFNENGSFDYTPNLNFFGIDTFTYQAFDGLNVSTIATVTIVVNSINDVPIAVEDDFELFEDTVLMVNSTIGVLSNDVDPDNYPQSLTAVLSRDVLSGSLELRENGSFIYVPNLEFHGQDSFSYKAYDGLNFSNETIVNITVNEINDSPFAINDTYFTMMNQVLAIDAPGILLNDYDVDNDSNDLSSYLVSNVTNGTLEFCANGSFLYTPNINFSGNDSFTYQISDGNSFSNNATVTIVVIAENTPPVANDDQYFVLQNTDLSISAPGILSNDSDSEGGVPLLSAILVSTVSHGTLILYDNGSFDYTPDTDWWGTDSFTYQCFDGLNESNVATVNISVIEENTIPIATDDTYEGYENTWLNISEPGVLGNDIDEDGGPDELSAVLVDDVSFGSLSLFANGSFCYSPFENWGGVDQFTYQCYDGLNYSNEVTVWLIIESDNVAPNGVNDVYSMLEDTLLTVSEPGVLGNDYDGDGGPDELSAVLVDDVSFGSLSLFANGSFCYQPFENWSGVDQFTYQCYDGQSYSNLTYVSINVTNVNDEPVAVDDSWDLQMNMTHIVNISENDYDVDGNLDLSSINITLLPLNGVVIINDNGTITYQPDSGFMGSELIQYTIADNAGAVSNEATVQLNLSDTIIDSEQTIYDRPFLIRHASDGDWGGAQSFIPSISVLSHIELCMKKLGTPSFDLTVELREDSIDGTVLDTITMNPSDFSSDWDWIDLNFNNVNVTPGMTYFIVLSPPPSGITDTFGYGWGYSLDDTISDSSLWFTRTSGSFWLDLPNLYDFTFKIYGSN